MYHLYKDESNDIVGHLKDLKRIEYIYTSEEYKTIKRDDLNIEILNAIILPPSIH